MTVSFECHRCSVTGIGTTHDAGRIEVPNGWFCVEIQPFEYTKSTRTESRHYKTTCCLNCTTKELAEYKFNPANTYRIILGPWA